MTMSNKSHHYWIVSSEFYYTQLCKTLICPHWWSNIDAGQIYRSSSYIKCKVQISQVYIFLSFDQQFLFLLPAWVFTWGKPQCVIPGELPIFCSLDFFLSPIFLFQPYFVWSPSYTKAAVDVAFWNLALKAWFYLPFTQNFSNQLKTYLEFSHCIFSWHYGGTTLAARVWYFSAFFLLPRISANCIFSRLHGRGDPRLARFTCFPFGLLSPGGGTHLGAFYARS